MSIVVTKEIAKAYGAQDVFEGVSLQIARGDRIGFVGPNGHGKTTLLKIMAGLEEPSQGTLTRQRGLRIGYLPQDPPAAGPHTLYGAMLFVFANLRQKQEKLDNLARRLSQPDADPSLLQRYGELQTAFEQAGGYTYETRIGQALGGLGFQKDQFDMPLAHLSGGQRTRALLAQLLLEEPDLLLLDEPTNHLDLGATEWLEEVLLARKGSLIVVSHDRYFLDKVATRIWEMAHGGLTSYRGNYSAYTQQRAEQLDRSQKEWQTQQEHIGKTEEFIRRNMAGQRTKEAQGRLKRLERFKRDEMLQRPLTEKHIRLNMTTNLRSGDLVLKTRDLLVGYSDNGGDVLFRSPDLELLRGERVALIGPNGAGKTTFLKTILEEVPPLSGSIRQGASVKIGYLAQAHADLHSGQTVLDAILDVENLPISQARSYLGRYLFSGDDVFKRLGALSGGERSRVALARLTLQGANFLLLDEPTNHLDIPSQEILEDVLGDFPGSVLLVSHDRYLVQALATQIWEVDEGELRIYKGGYDEYLGERARIQSEKKEANGDESASPSQLAWERSRLERQQRKVVEARVRHADKLEEQIHGLEQRLTHLQEQLVQASLVTDIERIHALTLEYRDIDDKLHRQMDAWSEMAEG